MSTPRKGFTLVELLVVIGIIAVLIGLLLPSLNKAREQAKTVQCLSNLRAIAQGLILYTSENKGSFPYGYFDGTLHGTNNTSKPNGATDWSTLLAGKVFTRSGATTYGEYLKANLKPGVSWSPIFSCPNAVPAKDDSPTARVLHYACHPRLMPTLDDKDNSLTAKPYLKPYVFGKIKRSQELILIFDAMQNLAVTNTDTNCGPVCNGIDQDGLYTNMTQNGRKWNYLLNDGTPGVLMAASINSPNKDFTGGSVPGAYAINNIRWRHGRGDAINVVYADCHAEARQLKQGRSTDLKVSNVYVDR